MVEVVVLNGPPGVGKTTVGRRLAGAVGDGVCIHGDALRDFLVTSSPGRPRGLSYVAAAALTGVYAAAGYGRVVADYVMEDPSHMDRFRDALPAGLAGSARLFTLWAPLPVVTAREAARPGRDRLGTRVTDCWSTIQANLHQLGTVIDADRPLEAVLADLEDRLLEPGPGSVRLPAMALTTVTAAGEQVLLRDLGPADLADLVAGVKDPLTQRWLPLPKPYSREAAAVWALTAVPAAAAAGTSLVRAIEVDGQFVGIVDLRRVDRATGSAEISYWATPAGRGRGVVTAAVQVLTGWALAPAIAGGLGLGRVEVRAAAGNRASQWVAEKAGYCREGLLRRAGRTHGGPVDLVVYSRTVDDPAPGAGR